MKKVALNSPDEIFMGLSCEFFKQLLLIVYSFIIPKYPKQSLFNCFLQSIALFFSAVLRQPLLLSLLMVILAFRPQQELARHRSMT
jgi:hypothetical protein